MVKENEKATDLVVASVDSLFALTFSHKSQTSSQC